MSFRDNTARQHAAWPITCGGILRVQTGTLRSCNGTSTPSLIWPKEPMKPHSTWGIPSLWLRRALRQVRHRDQKSVWWQCTSAWNLPSKKRKKDCALIICLCSQLVSTSCRHIVIIIIYYFFYTSANLFCPSLFIHVSISENYYKRSRSMLDDIVRFEKTILAQEQQIK